MRIASEDEVAEGQTCKFEFLRGEQQIDGFVARHKGKLVAYENLCRHLPLNLDYGDNRFFDRRGEFLVCQAHGALYHPQTGQCVQGPCGGESLYPLEIEVRDGAIWLIGEGT